MKGIQLLLQFTEGLSTRIVSSRVVNLIVCFRLSCKACERRIFISRVSDSEVWVWVHFDFDAKGFEW